MGEDNVEQTQYLDQLQRLDKEEVEGVRKKWSEAGYYYAPIIVDTLSGLEKAIRQETPKKVKVFLFDRDMYPFSVVKKVWSGDKNINYDLIPASSAIFGTEPRIGLEPQLALLKEKNLNPETWIKRIGRVDESVMEEVNKAIDRRQSEIIAFCRTILDRFGLNSESFGDDQLVGLLKGKTTAREVFGRRALNVDYVVLFESAYAGTYVEMTRNIIRRIFPDLEVRGAMLSTNNPRIAELTTDGVGDFELIPKDCDIVKEAIGGKVRYKVRTDPRGEWSSAFNVGLQFGVADLKESKYEEPESPPDIPHEYAEKQWIGDFGFKQPRESLNLKRWQLVDSVVLGDFKKLVNPP